MRFPSRAALALLFLASPLLAQVSEQVTVHYVEVPVSVVDSSGNPVRGLTAENFQVFDAKTRIKTSSFETIDFASPQSVAKVGPRNPAAHRMFFLLFDLAFSSPLSLARSRQAARTFLTDSVLPSDLVGVGTIDIERGFRLLTGITTDRSAVLSAIDNPLGFRGTDPLQIAGSGTPLKLDELLRQPVAPLSQKDSDYLEHLTDVTRGTAQSDDSFARARVMRQFQALGELALTLDAVEGRKQVVLLTEGFDPTLIRGRDLRDAKGSQDENNNVVNGELWKVDSEKRFGSSEGLNRLEDMARYFRGSDVVLHAIDIQGVRSQNTVAEGSKVNSNESLFLVARPTGGQVFQSSNDLKNSFSRMLHAQEVVYILGFQAPVKQPGKFHDLDVKVVNAPAATMVVHREGYFESGRTNSSLEHTFTAAEIILKDIPQSDVHVATIAAAFPGASANAQVPVVVDISGADLLKAAKGDSLDVEVFLYAFDEQGTIQDHAFQRITLDIPKVGAKLRASGVKYVANLTLPAGKYSVKTLIRLPDSDKKGFARAEVVVPKTGDVALLQPLLLDDPTAWLIIRGTEHGENASYPFQVNGTPFVPSASGRLPNGVVHKLAVFVWNAMPEELTWETTPHATLLGQIKSANATKLVLQLDDPSVIGTFGVTVRKNGSAPLTASIPLVQQ